MKLENKKPVLMIIIVLLCIFVPLSGAAVAFKFIGSPASGDDLVILDNPNKEFLFKGMLYFYQNDELLGVYKCEKADGYCGYAYEMIDDNNYDVSYYADNRVDKFSLINSRYALITDTDVSAEYEYHQQGGVILYDVINKKQITKYKAVKNYTLGLDNNLLIVQNNDNLWGVLSLESDQPKLVSTINYEYVGLTNRITEDGQVDTTNFLVKQSNTWFLINGETFQEVSTPTTNQINDYSDNYLLTKVRSNYYLSNYNGIVSLDSNGYNYLEFLDNYLVTVDRTNKLQVINPTTNTSLTTSYDVTGKTYNVTMSDNVITIVINDEVFTHNVL